MKVGLIGYGNMGGAVARALLGNGSVAPAHMFIYNRTASRLSALSKAYPDLNVASSAGEVATGADLLFLATKSGNVREVMAEIASSLSPRTHLVTINGGVEIANLKKMFDGPVSKAIPSMTIETGRGVTILCHDPSVSKEDRDRLSALFSRSGRVWEVREEQVEAASDLTSCAPGLFAELMLKFAEEGAKKGRFSTEEAMAMVGETMLGTAILLADRGVSPDQLKCQVATKGGITEEGLKVLDREMPRVYSEVFEATLKKHIAVKAKINAEFDAGHERTLAV